MLYERSAELLGKRDNDALRPADVSEPVRGLVLHFANELGPMGAHTGNDSVDIIDGEHDATHAQRVHRRIYRSEPDRFGRVELVQLNALSIGSPHHREGGPDILEPDQLPDQGPFDSRFALELEAQFDEERLGGLEIVDNDEDVVHPFERHVLPSLALLLMPRTCRTLHMTLAFTCARKRAQPTAFRSHSLKPNALLIQDRHRRPPAASRHVGVDETSFRSGMST